MEFKFVEKQEIKIVGMRERINLPNNTIPQLWMRFMEKSHLIKNKGNIYYGIAENMAETKEGYSFDEIVGVEVTNTESIPKGMELKIIPAQNM